MSRDYVDFYKKYIRQPKDIPLKSISNVADKELQNVENRLCRFKRYIKNQASFTKEQWYWEDLVSSIKLVDKDFPDTANLPRHNA